MVEPAPRCVMADHFLECHQASVVHAGVR
jgi:hypothetical protein